MVPRPSPARRFEPALDTRLRTKVLRIFAFAPLVVVVASVSYAIVGMVGHGGIARYRLDGETLRIDPGGSFRTATKRIPLDRILSAEVMAGRLGRREAGVSFPGFCLGRYGFAPVGSVWSASNCRGPGLVVRATSEPLPVYLTPPEPEEFRQTLQRRGILDVEGAHGRVFPIPVVPLLVANLLLGGALVVFLVLISAGPSRLGYHVRTGTLGVETFFGRKEWPTQGWTVRPARASFRQRIWGVAMPGYCTGRFLIEGRLTHVYATGREGLLLEGEARVFLTPSDPEAMVAALQKSGVTVLPSESPSQG